MALAKVKRASDQNEFGGEDRFDEGEAPGCPVNAMRLQDRGFVEQQGCEHNEEVGRDDGKLRQLARRFLANPGSRWQSVCH